MDVAARLTTVAANGHLTQRTVPVRQKTTAVCCWTLATLTRFDSDGVGPNLETTESVEFLYEDGIGRSDVVVQQFVDFTNPIDSFKFELSRWEQTFLALKQDLTVMRLQWSVDKCFGHVQVQKLAVPGLFAPHAVRVECCIQKVPPRASPTLGQVAVGTLNRFAVGPVKDVAADRALFRHS